MAGPPPVHEPGKYRKKPIEIEAIEWTGDNIEAVHAFLGVKNFRYQPEDGLHILTLEGPLFARQGDWIIRAVQGEFYPCKPDIFEATYEPV